MLHGYCVYVVWNQCGCSDGIVGIMDVVWSLRGTCVNVMWIWCICCVGSCKEHVQMLCGIFVQHVSCVDVMRVLCGCYVSYVEQVWMF